MNADPVVSATEGWREPARRALVRLRGGGPAWSYRVGTQPGVEPTALACLGLLASRRSAADDDLAPIQAAADWLAVLQNPDGSLGVAPRQPTPGWTTPYALLVWSALARHEARRRRAARWLLHQEGERIDPRTDPAHLIGHDTTLVGWPWVAGTHSWLEPTALAVLALNRAGYGAHPRVRDGLRLIHDRAIASGGWNYGNKEVFGRTLRPQPAPTGLALLALARTHPADGDHAVIVERALSYLLETLPGVRAAASLAWGLLGLRAWRREPPAAEAWLAEAHRRTVGRPDAAPRLAQLLLAAGADALDLFEPQTNRYVG
jgi:hypothetical protein